MKLLQLGWEPVPYLSQILVFWVTCGVKMISLQHGWGCHPIQTASHIHVRQMQSVWAHWYAVHRHTVAALVLISYTHPTWLRLWCSRSLVESTWCHNVSWGCQPIQSASCFRIRHLQSIWAHWYAVHITYSRSRGSIKKTVKIMFAPNAIFRVVSCPYILSSSLGRAKICSYKLHYHL